jgi:hypothetical protein
MKLLKPIGFLVICVIAGNAWSQKTNAEKILGCWTLKEMVSPEVEANDPEMIEAARNSVVCFDATGKFTMDRPGGIEPQMSGTYKISPDGKTMTQGRDIQDHGVDQDGEIVTLDDKHFVVKTEMVTMYFERK